MDSQELLEMFRQFEIELVTGVPDSLLDSFIKELDNPENSFQHLVAANEGNAVAIGIGHYLASGKNPVIYMQNSGLGNAINPLASLTHKNVYSIPLILVIGWRGEPGLHDEPQHMVQGAITRTLLENLEIPFVVVGADTPISEVQQFLSINLARSEGPMAILVRREALSSDKKSYPHASNATLTREEAISRITDALPSNSLIVATTGKLSRELDEKRSREGITGIDFLTVGGMGHASSIALGIALTLSQRLVVCLDGDGAALMHLGAIAVIGNSKPAHFIHILINNGVHESVGNSSIGNKDINFQLFSQAVGYSKYYKITDANDILRTMQQAHSGQGPTFIEVLTNSESRPNLGRPQLTPIKNRDIFANHIRTLS